MTHNIIEEVILNWTDLTGEKTGYTKYGSNKFYKAILTEESPGYKLCLSWGRVGTTGQGNCMRFANLEAAKRTLERKVESKVKKGYTRLAMRTEATERAKAKEHGVDLNKPTQKKVTPKSHNLEPEVENLLRLMYGSTGRAIQQGLSAAAGASAEAPLGNLDDTQLDKGADLLDELEGLLGLQRKGKAVLELTNEFFTNIPRKIRRSASTESLLLNNQDRIDDQRKFITLLRDAHLQKDVFADAARVDDPTDVWYDGLGCELAFVSVGSEERNRVSRLFLQGQSPRNSNFYNKLQVVRIWKVERRGKRRDFDFYAAQVTKHNLATGVTPAWHGTRTENLMGIAKSGLLMPENLPRGVMTSGKAFGMGIYHAPRWPDAGQSRPGGTRYNGALKSMNYTSLEGAYYLRSDSGSKGFLFLEEMALGRPDVHHSSCGSIKRPRGGCDYIYAEASRNSYLSHDEVVTFDENASRLTHLLEIGYA